MTEALDLDVTYDQAAFAPPFADDFGAAAFRYRSARVAMGRAYGDVADQARHRDPRIRELELLVEREYRAFLEERVPVEAYRRLRLTAATLAHGPDLPDAAMAALRSSIPSSTVATPKASAPAAASVCAAATAPWP